MNGYNVKMQRIKNRKAKGHTPTFLRWTWGYVLGTFWFSFCLLSKFFVIWLYYSYDKKISFTLWNKGKYMVAINNLGQAQKYTLMKLIPSSMCG